MKMTSRDPRIPGRAGAPAPARVVPVARLVGVAAGMGEAMEVAGQAWVGAQALPEAVEAEAGDLRCFRAQLWVSLKCVHSVTRTSNDFNVEIHFLLFFLSFFIRWFVMQ